MPKVVDKDQRKREIAAKAIELFLERGFEATSISQVARAAGIGKGTIYEYFASKRELVFFAMKAWSDALEEGAEGLVDETQGVEERLRAFCHAVMDAFVADERALQFFIASIQLIFSEGGEHNFIKEISTGFRRMVIQILLEGVSEGVFKAQVARETEKISINLFGFLDGIGFHYMINRDFFDLRDQIDLYLDQLLASLKKE